MPGLAIDTGILSLVVLLGAVILIALLAWRLSRMYGSAVWLIFFALVPLSLLVIGGETSAAWGPLAMIVGLAAVPLAANIAFSMLLSAHLLTKEWLKEQESSNSEITQKRNYGEPRWKGKTIQWYLAAFVAISLMFCGLCIFRSFVSLSFLIGGVLSILGGLLFFFYPIISLILGLCWAKAWNSCVEAHRRFQQKQLWCATYKAQFEGSGLSDREVKALEQASLRAIEAGEDPEYYLKKQSETLKNLLVYTRSNREDAVKLAELHSPSDDGRGNFFRA